MFQLVRGCMTVYVIIDGSLQYEGDDTLSLKNIVIRLVCFCGTMKQFILAALKASN